MIPLRLERFPRPERSGIIAVLAAYVLLAGYFEAVNICEGFGFSLQCMLMPWDCPCTKCRIIAKDEQPRKYYEMPIYLGAGPCERKDKERCGHWDVSFDGQVFHERELGYDSVGCASFWSDSISIVSMYGYVDPSIEPVTMHPAEFASNIQLCRGATKDYRWKMRWHSAPRETRQSSG